MTRFLAGVSLTLLAVIGIGSTTTGAFAANLQPDSLILHRTYNGTVEIAGDLIRMQYTAGHLYAEIADLAADGIFRNGFEVMP